MIQPSRFRVLLHNGDTVILCNESLRDPKVNVALIGTVRFDKYTQSISGPAMLFCPPGHQYGMMIPWVNLHSPATNWAVLRRDGDILLVSPITLWESFFDPLVSVGEIIGLPEDIKGVFRCNI